MVMMWIWFALAVALFIVEAATTDLVAVWFALSALALGAIAGLAPNLQVVWQTLIFVALSGVLVAATRPLAQKLKRRGKDTETNLELVVGHKALVTEDINNDMEQGAVKINGLIWTARSQNGETVAKDTLVVVKEIQGNKAIVAVENKEN